MTGQLAADAEALIARTVVARGLPAAVTDPVVIARLAGLVRPADAKRPAGSSRRAARESSRITGRTHEEGDARALHSTRG